MVTYYEVQTTILFKWRVCLKENKNLFVVILLPKAIIIYGLAGADCLFMEINAKCCRFSLQYV